MEEFYDQIGHLGLLIWVFVALNLIVFGLRVLPGVGRKTRKTAHFLSRFNEHDMIDIIARGDRFAADKRQNAFSEHSVTWPARAITIGLTCVILYQFAVFIADELANTGESLTLTMFYVFGPLLLYVNLYQWLFRVQIDGDRLSLMTPFFQWHDFQLSQLRDLHDDGHGSYRLRFANGRRAWMVKYVNGHRSLRRALDAAIVGQTA
jgi:hypothetical protein